jgi:hypothetical protein
MLTLAATSEVGEVDGVGGVAEALCPIEALRTITHEPTITSLRLAVRSAVNFVALVKVTAVCIPLPCTWSVWPSTAATSPLTPGKRPCPASPWLLPAAEVGDVVLADVAPVVPPPDPQADSTTTQARPRAEAGRMRRDIAWCS